jgi:hypothetical protein
VTGSVGSLPDVVEPVPHATQLEVRESGGAWWRCTRCGGMTAGGPRLPEGCLPVGDWLGAQRSSTRLPLGAPRVEFGVWL